MANPVPNGPTGSWSLYWSDEFTGTAIDTTKWYVFDGVARQGVICEASNVTVSGGYLNLKLATKSSGCEINSWNTQGAGLPSAGYGFAYGDCVEARVFIPGSATIPNWPAFWTSGHLQAGTGDFSGGELDIFEGLSGQLHIDENNTGDNVVGPAPAGTWGGGWHTYTCVRNGPASAATYDTYWDGKLVWATKPTAEVSETGSTLQGILLTNGYSATYGGPLQAPTTMQVDYVRAWKPGTATQYTFTAKATDRKTGLIGSLSKPFTVS